MRSLRWIAFAWLMLGAGPALAQDRGVSYSTWIVADNVVTLRYVLPVTEAQRLTRADVPLLTMGRLEDYLLEHLSVDSAGGECPAIDQGFDLGRVDPLAVGPDLYGFEIFFRCRDPRQLVLRNTALFARSPGHVDFARIQIHDRDIEQLFTARQQQLAIPDDRPLAAAGLFALLGMGARHVLHSADRWCFILGMLLIVGWGWRKPGYLLAALAAGYLLALMLAASGWILPRPLPLEAFVGFLVALLGGVITQRMLRSAGIPGAIWPAGLLLLALTVALAHSPASIWMLLGAAALGAGMLLLARETGFTAAWPVLAVLFALLDGFVLPGVLPPAHLPRAGQLRMLIGFDLGALSSEALLLALAAGAWFLIRRRRFGLSQALMQDVCAAALSGLGTFWLLSRLR